MLITKFQKRVYTMALVVTKNIHDADDATQDVFISLYQNMGRISNPEKIEGWLIKTSMNKARDILRKKKIREWLPLFNVKESVQPTAEEETYNNELKVIFDAWTRNRLSLNEQIVFQLRFGEEIELKEIAEILEMNLNTVKTYLHRAMNKLKADSEALLEGEKSE